MIEEAAEAAAAWAEREARARAHEEALALGLLACAQRLRILISERGRLIRIAAAAEKASHDLFEAANPD